MKEIAYISASIVFVYLFFWLYFLPYWRGKTPLIRYFYFDDNIDTVWRRIQAPWPNIKVIEKDDLIYVTRTIFQVTVNFIYEKLDFSKPYHEVIRLREIEGKQYPFGEDSWIAITAKEHENGTMVMVASKAKHTGLWGLAEDYLFGNKIQKRAGQELSQVKKSRKFDLTKHKNEIILSLIAIASFATYWGWDGALLLTPIILLHEYGHLLAYRMTGQKGSTMFLVPFFGGLAVAQEPHKSEFDAAFCALMGPAICAPLSILLFAGAYYAGDHWTWWWLAYGAMICATMNALNMVPILPFDGGHIMESFAKTIAPEIASKAMLTISIGGAYILYQAGYENFAMITAMWGIPSILQGSGSITHTNKRPFSIAGGCFMTLFYSAVLAIHGAVIWLTYYYFY